MATSREQVTEIVNQSLEKLGYGSYQLPTEGTDEELQKAWASIAALAPSAKNALLEQIVVILKYRNYGIMFDAEKNPIRKFFRNDINFGGGEEDIYHEIVQPVEGCWAQDFAGLDNDSADSDAKAEKVAKNLVRYYNYSVKKKFHTKKQPLDIPMSISEYEQKQIFTPEGFARFIDVKMANLQWSAEVALLDRVINDVKYMIENGGAVIKAGVDLNTPAGVTNHVEDLKVITDAMTMPSTAFNYAGVRTMSGRDDLFLFCAPEYINRLQTRGFANAFNIEYYRNKNQLVILPFNTDLGTDPTTEKPILAALIDRRAIVESIFYWEVKPFVVPNTDYTNYFLKGQVLAGYNEFFNAVAFAGDEIGEYNPATHTIVDDLAGSENGVNVNVTNESLDVEVGNTTAIPVDVVDGNGVLV